jgi:transcriptional regulator
MNQKFAPRAPADVLRLMRAHPLAWLVSGHSADPHATLLPLLPVISAEGVLAGLSGHLPRANPQFQALQREPRALVLFLGPEGYVSPSWMSDRSQAPTWNYASCQCVVNIEFHDDPGALRAHLEELVDTMEAGRERAWAVEEMGARYSSLAARIVPFVAHIRELRERYKLGQDERDDVYADITLGLADGDNAPLLEWMRYFNPGRG